MDGGGGAPSSIRLTVVARQSLLITCAEKVRTSGRRGRIDATALSHHGESRSVPPRDRSAIPNDVNEGRTTRPGQHLVVAPRSARIGSVVLANEFRWRPGQLLSDTPTGTPVRRAGRTGRSHRTRPRAVPTLRGIGASRCFRVSTGDRRRINSSPTPRSSEAAGAGRCR